MICTEYCQRQTDQTDRRIIFIVITPPGVQYLLRVGPVRAPEEALWVFPGETGRRGQRSGNNNNLQVQATYRWRRGSPLKGRHRQ